ncbi:hypothetical protein D3OALGB2SA_125 [Olavius algarvensis associated proteobacterium Delta 3]|nr:hypothetical protein D3OALGB2SA_125 [Olavius algarvensis associated proteobacterium Delta 3]
MTKTQRIVAWMIGAGIAFLLLLGGGVLVALQYIDADPIIDRAQTEISKQIGGEVILGPVEARLFPMPHIIIRGSRFSVGDVAEGTVASLSVFPELLPIFQATFKPSKVLLTSPAVQIRLPQATQAQGSPDASPRPAGIQAKLSDIIAQLQAAAPNLNLRVEDGTLRLSRSGSEAFSLDDIDLRVDVRSLQADLACDSNLWQRLSTRWTFDPELFPGNGRVSLFQFEPHRLRPFLPSDLPVQLGESLVNLDIQIEHPHQRGMSAKVQGSLPKLTLISQDEKLVILGERFEGKAVLDDAEQRFTVKRLTLESPKLTADGELILSSGSPNKTLRVHGTEVDGDAIRRTVLFLAGNLPVVREIFDYLRGGYVPEITLSSFGDTWEDLSIIEHIHIQGTFEKGRVHIPAVNLDLDSVEGEALMADGFLNGTRLNGTIGNTFGKRGQLRVGFRGTDAPFHLEMDLDTDLAELPGHLKGLIPSTDFQAWLKRVTESSGRAQGRLILGEALDDIDTAFQIDKLKMQAKLDFMPYPVSVDSGKLSYRNRILSVENLVGRIRNSSITQLSGEMIWGDETMLRIISGTADLDLRQLFEWFSKVDGAAEVLAPVNVRSGRLAVKRVSVEGPLFKPQSWDYVLSGAAEGMTLQTPAGPDPLNITSLIFSASPNTFSVRKSHIDISDASMDIEGELKGQLPNVDSLRVGLTGTLGDQSYTRFRDLAALPPVLAIQTPITIQGGQVFWERSGSVALKGAIKSGGDLHIIADLEQGPDGIEIRTLKLEDDLSNATIRVHVMGHELQLGFSGNLDKATVAKLLDHRRVSAGSISGDFSARFHQNIPSQSNIKGILSGKALVLPLEDGGSLQIESFMALGTGSALTIQTIDALWGGSRIRINGRLDATPDRYTAKLKLRSDSIRWDRLSTYVLSRPGDASGDNENAGVDRWPVNAVIDIETDRFVYESYEWQSVKAKATIADRRIEVEVTEASLCGISTPGRIVIDPNTVIQADFSAASKTPNLESTTSCLFKTADRVDGNYRFKAVVQGKGAADTFLESLQGSMEFHARDGRVYGRGSFGVLKRILAFVNLTEVFAGSAPDFSSTDFGYRQVRAIADIEGPNLILKEAIIDRDNMKITGQGRVALENQQLDLTVIVAPLKTVDRAVGMLPVFGKILDGHLLTIPLKVTGPVSDPDVQTVAPGNVGRGLIGITERTLKLPFEMFQP